MTSPRHPHSSSCVFLEISESSSYFDEEMYLVSSLAEIKPGGRGRRGGERYDLEREVFDFVINVFCSPFLHPLPIMYFLTPWRFLHFLLHTCSGL